MKKSIAIVSLLFSLVAHSQNPVNWTFSAKKIADKTYEVTLSAAVQSPWHIYSQLTPDGGPLPTKIDFNKNPLYSLDGKAEETGKVLTKHEEVFGVDVIYFDGAVKFVQTVKLKSNAKTNISGKIEYMTCNDVQCLPPTEQAFNIKLE